MLILCICSLAYFTTFSKLPALHFFDSLNEQCSWKSKFAPIFYCFIWSEPWSEREKESVSKAGPPNVSIMKRHGRETGLRFWTWKREDNSKGKKKKARNNKKNPKLLKLYMTKKEVLNMFNYILNSSLYRKRLWKCRCC